LRYGDDQEDRRDVREIDADVFAAIQLAPLCVGPKVQVNVQQQRVSKGDADDRYGVRDAQQRGPGVRTEIEQAVQRDDEIAGVPAAHRKRQRGEQSFQRGEFAACEDELNGHPERQQCADAVTDDL
jgi:hypothetical protein